MRTKGWVSVLAVIGMLTGGCGTYLPANVALLGPAAVAQIASTGSVRAASTAWNHFTVDDAVIGYAADALLKAATAIRQHAGGQPQAIAKHAVVVRFEIINSLGSMLMVDATDGFQSVLQKEHPTHNDAVSALRRATIEQRSAQFGNSTGNLVAVPTILAPGASATYQMSVEAVGPAGAEGVRQSLGAFLVDNFGKNFHAVVH